MIWAGDDGDVMWLRGSTRLLGGEIILHLPSEMGAPRQWAQTFPCPSTGCGPGSLSQAHARQMNEPALTYELQGKRYMRA